MASSLAGKVALITGSSKGIGAAAATELARLGAKVVINYSLSATLAEELIAKIGPSQAIAVKADVGSLPEIDNLVQQTVQWGGKIDIVIANAAIANYVGLEDTTEAAFDESMRINVKGPYFLVQKAAPHIPSGGKVIMVSSSVTNLSIVPPNYLLYAASKGAIEQMTRILAKDLGRKGISINCVAPGPTGTALFYQGKSQEIIDRLASSNPFNRLAEPQEIGKIMAWLASDDSSWVNGQVVKANGGMTS